MSEREELQAELRAEAQENSVPVIPIVLESGMPAGLVAIFLFPDDPMTLIDSGTEFARPEVEAEFTSAGKRVEDLNTILLTHGHNDHVDGSKWMKNLSGCEVLMHELDMDTSRSYGSRDVFMTALGMPQGMRGMRFGRMVGAVGSESAQESGESPSAQTQPVERRAPWEPRERPEMTSLKGGETIQAGSAKLRVEHHPGHARGHIWAIDDATGVIFGGDYLLAPSSTNPGFYPDPNHPIGMHSMLKDYEDGLKAMAALDAPVVFPSHGPPVTDHKALIARRLERSQRRTTQLLEELSWQGESTASDLTSAVHGEKAGEAFFQFVSDTYGRLDMLLAEGKVSVNQRDDGVWLFSLAG